MNPIASHRYHLQPGGVNGQAQWCARRAGADATASREVTPIGSVEWTREYALAYGVTLPEWQTYPDALRPWLGREVRAGRFTDAARGEFVKPVKLKAFTGALLKDLEEAAEPDEPCWISDAVEFAAEWRCYILAGKVVGWGQYGDGDDAEPDLAQVRDMLAAWPGPAGWALDVGRLADGRQVLVEANDGWALGYYKGCPPDAYLRVIAARWAELTAAVEGKP